MSNVHLPGGLQDAWSLQVGAARYAGIPRAQPVVDARDLDCVEVHSTISIVTWRPDLPLIILSPWERRIPGATTDLLWIC